MKSIATSLSISEGKPLPLGATCTSDGHVVNFAVWSPRADMVDLCLYWDENEPERECARVRLIRKTRGTWHVGVAGLPKNCRYGYRVQGPWLPEKGQVFNHAKLLLDPYARLVDRPTAYHPSMVSLLDTGEADKTDSGAHAPKGVLVRDDSFDWGGVEPPRLPMQQSIVYEVHVKGFSQTNPAVPEELRGTYAGLAHPASVGYLKDLGITTVQLLPVHHHMDDGFLLERGLVNYWGYNTLAFFAPERRYAATDDPIREFREMVKTFHSHGMEVILDVVYNHTCETGVDGPTCLLRGFDNAAYYRTRPGDPGSYDDVTGCGNSVDISHADVMALVMDSLRYWVTEMGVDGFRFDLAATLGRDPSGFSRHAAFFRAAHQDPVLREVKLIAEPWDIGLGGYQIGNFPTDWYELNGKFRDCVRRFWRGDPKVVGEFATRITGSADLFAHNDRNPAHSLNMVTSHDGFTLIDLVSFNEKHNEANGEENRDGDTHNISYNYGVEGGSEDPAICELRRRQVRNFLATMVCAQGVPFITAGDERLRSQRGNNNAYCQDNAISWLNWTENEESAAMRRYVRKLLAFRRENPSLCKIRFFSGDPIDAEGLTDISWLNTRGEVKDINDWNIEKSGAFGMMIHREASYQHKPLCGFLLFLYNARNENLSFTLPDHPKFRWECVVDTVDAEGDPHDRTADPGSEVKLCARSMQIWRELA